MKILIIVLVALIIAGVAYAQSTALPIVMGTLSTTCSGSLNPCWIPIGSANPLPASSN